MKVPVARIEKFVVPEKEEHANPLMKCVWLDVQGKRLLATDGHMGVRETALVDEADVSGPIPVEAFDLARKELKNIQKAVKEALPDPWLRFLCNEDAITVENLLTNTIHLVTRPKVGIDQKFPNVDAVFPTLTDKPSVTLNGEYLSRLVGSLCTEGIGLSLWVNSSDKAVVVATETGKAVAVVMPMLGTPNFEEINRRGLGVQIQIQGETHQ